MVSWIGHRLRTSAVRPDTDFIPVLGHLDDVIVIPGLIALALWFVPVDVVRECRLACQKESLPPLNV